MKRLSFFLCITVLSAPSGQAEANDKPTLCQGNYHSEADAVAQLKRLAATHSNLAEWKARAAAVRQQFLTGARLSPLPKRTPLNPIIKNKRRYDGYTVESAAFEARPGFLFTATCTGRLAAKANARACSVRTAITAARKAGGSGPTSNTAAPRWRGWARWCSRTT